MRRTSQLFLLVLAVLLGGGALWYALRSPTDSGRGELALHEPGPESTTSGEGPAAALLQGGTARERSDAAVTQEEAPAPVESLEENFDLDGARWIDVRVASPLASPPDETLGVILVAHREGGEFKGWAARQMRGGFRPRSLTNRVRGRESEVAWALRTVDETGVARVPAPAKARRVFLFVDGRYLYLEESREHELDEPAEVVQLNPVLGAWVTGEFVMPAGAKERGIASDAFEGNVTLMSTDFMDGNNSWESFELDGKGTFEFRGLRTGTKYFLAANLEALAPYTEMGFTFDPGEHREVFVRPELGARITGRVLDETGSGVEGAHVDVDSKRPGMGMMYAAGDADAETDAEGRFVLLGVAAGKIELEARRSGYRAAEPIELELVQDDDVAGIELVLPAGERIAGRALWPDGQPVVGAKIVAQAAGSRGSGESGEDGAFTIGGLDEGKHLVRAEKHAEVDGAEGPLWRGAEPDVATGTSNLTLRMVEPLTLSGSVRQRGGEPVEEFKVTAKVVTDDPAGLRSRVNASSEDESGEFRLESLYPGEYDVTAEAEGFQWPGDPRRVALPGETEPLVLELAGLLEVSGRVVSPAGTPVAGAKVVASQEDGSDQPWLGWAQERATDETDEQGHFELAELPLGLVTLRASANGFAPSDKVPVELVEGAEPPVLELALYIGGRITGIVNDETGAPMVGQRVGYGSGMPMGAFAAGGGEGGNVAKTDAAGSFIFENVPAGKWTVSAFPGGEEMMETMMQAQDETAFVDIMSKILSERVEVTEGGDVHVVLGPEPKRPVRVFGKVTASGEPRANSMVVALSEGTALMQGLKMVRTGEDGGYELTVDRPGPYVLALGEGNNGPQIDYWIDVPDADEYEVDIELPTASISGRVLNDAGDLLTKIAVGVTREDGGSTFAGLSEGQAENTGSDGSFTIGGLKAGRYTVRAGINGPFARSGDGYSIAVAGGVEVGEDEAVTGLEFRLTKPGVIEGVVKGPDGAPLVGVTIFARNAEGRVLQALSSVITDPAGRFQYGGLPEGPITLSARSATSAAADSAPINVRPGETREVELELESATVLVVTVVDADNEAVRADITVYDSTGREVSGLYSSQNMEAIMSEGLSTRERKLGPLPSGRYRVEAQTRDGRSATKPVTLKGQDERKLRIRLRD